MEKELAHYMKFDGLLPENEPVAKNDEPEPSGVEVQCFQLKYNPQFFNFHMRINFLP